MLYNFGKLAPQIAKNMPARLFKFMESRWVEDFISGKSILIGTISDFRNIEKHQLDKGDEMEGRLDIDVTGMRINTDDRKYRPLKNYLASRNVTMNDCTFNNWSGAIRIQSAEWYVFCASLEMNESICDKLDSKYDTCVEIGNPAEFARAVFNKMNTTLNKIQFQIGAKEVTYKNRLSKADSSEFESGCFLKDKKFEDQKEFRLIIKSPEKVSSPRCIEVDMSRADARICWQR